MPKRKPRYLGTPIQATSAPSAPKEKTVRIKDAQNGHVVSSYDHEGNEHLLVAKSKTEAHRHAKKLLGLDKGVEKEMARARAKAKE